MEQVKVYDHAGNEFLASSQEMAAAAVDSGQYFLEPPVESLADSIGLVPVVPVVADPSGVTMQKDGNDRLFVYDKKGKRYSMWAVDAKECVKSGQFFWAPPAAEEVEAEKKEVAAKPGRGRTK